MKPTLGIVGFGRFGRFAAFHLRDHLEISVFDSGPGMEEARKAGYRTGSLEEIAALSIVLLCVPISRFRDLLKEMAPHLKEGTLVADACSVKEVPVSEMRTLLPSHVEILGTHPLFGPRTAAQGLQGKKIVLCPVRVRHVPAIAAFLKRLGLTVLVSSPEAHDRAMASTQAVVHFLGKAFHSAGLGPAEMATPGYETLISLLGVVRTDTVELSRDLQTFNRFAGSVRERLIEAMMEVHENLKKSEKKESEL
jgi:prephenate dehydrogenase